MVKMSSLRNLLRAAVLVTVAMAFLMPAPLRAGLLPLTLEEMVAVADEVVAVRVAETKSELAQGRITTTTRLTVLETYKGKSKGELELTSLGGRVGTLVMDVPNIPTFHKGEESILFLSRPIDRMSDKARAHFNLDSPMVKSFQVIGGHQGKFLLISNEGIPNSSERKGNDPIPFNTKVVRRAGALTGDPQKAPNWSDFRSSVQALVVAQEQKAAEKGPKTEITGIIGKFHIPEKIFDKTIRHFDPLPSMAYASDEELGVLKKALEEAQKAANAGGEDKDE